MLVNFCSSALIGIKKLLLLLIATNLKHKVLRAYWGTPLRRYYGYTIEIEVATRRWQHCTHTYTKCSSTLNKFKRLCPFWLNHANLRECEQEWHQIFFWMFQNIKTYVVSWCNNITKMRQAFHKMSFKIALLYVN